MSRIVLPPEPLSDGVAALRAREAGRRDMVAFGLLANELPGLRDQAPAPG